jgi:phage shock protein C
MDRLYRSRKSRMMSGVCGGLGEYFNIDPVIVRIAFVVAAFGWGASIIAYILLWIIVPQKSMVYVKNETNDDPGRWEETPDEAYDEACSSRSHYNEVFVERSEKDKNSRHMILGGLLIGFGALWLFGNFIPDFDPSRLWPLALVGLGAFIILKTPRFRRNKERSNEV